MNTTATIQTQLTQLVLTIKVNTETGSMGGTLDFDSKVINKEVGYFASRKAPSIILSTHKFSTLDTEQVVELLKKLYFKANSFEYLGYWVDSDRIYIDLTTWFENGNDAIKFAVEQEQIAIYDCKNKVAINVVDHI